MLPQLLVYLKRKNKGKQMQELTLLLIVESYLCILPPIYAGWILGGCKNPINATCVKPAIAEITV